MRLSYRGLPYTCEPQTMDEAETQLRGRYRGQNYALMYPRHIPVPQPVLDLQYRGITYRTKTMGEIEARRYPTQNVAMAEATAFSSAPLASKRSSGKQALMSEIGRVHRENLQLRLQHRLNVARAQGNTNLISQLENEMHQIA